MVLRRDDDVLGKGNGDGDGEKQGDVSDVGKVKATGLGSTLDVGVREDSQVPSLPDKVGDDALHREPRG